MAYKSFSLLLLLSLSFTSHSSAKTFNVYERIVENWKDVSNGVPIDYRYNESIAEDGGFPSVPGCPKSDNGIPWVYYGSPPKCYLTGTSDPCSKGGDWNSKLFLQHGSPYGVCGCACLETLDPNVKVETGKRYFCKELDFTGKEIELVYLPEYKKCFYLGRSNIGGPCKPNEWLVRAEEANKFSGYDGEVALKCVKCPEKNPDNCYPGGGGGGASLDIKPHECPEGTKYSRLLQKCVRRAQLFRFKAAVG